MCYELFMHTGVITHAGCWEYTRKACKSRAEKNRMAAKTFGKKKQQQSRVFLDVIWKKEQERVVENKRDEFCRKKNMKIQSSCETVRNVSGQQGENER